jgi:hypothetical protein
VSGRRGGATGGDGSAAAEDEAAGGGTGTSPPPETTPTQTAPAKPAPEPTRSQPPTAPEPESEPEPVEQVKSIVTAGGTVVVRCVGSTASIISTSPLAGFGIVDIDPGPGAEVSVKLRALILTVGVTVRCTSGGPQASIQLG